MKHWRVEVRRDTVYYIDANTESEAIEAAEIEDHSLITDYQLDWVRTIQSFQVDEEGNYLESQEDDEE